MLFRSVPLSTAIMRSTRATEILLEAGADANVEDGRGEPVWWTVIVQGDRGDSDVRRLELLLTHGADTTKRNRRGGGPIEEAVQNERWPKVWLLAQRMPGAKDTVVGPDGETVQGRLRREVKLLQESGKPLPEQMRTALEKFEAK